MWVGLSDDDLSEVLAKAEIPVTPAAAGLVLDLGARAELQVLAVGKNGAILPLESGRFRALLPLGAGEAGLEALDYGRVVGPVSALLLAESGYAPLNPPAWIANLHPQVVLLSVAPGDRQSLPFPETMEAVQGYTLLRTDRNGWIEITTDGRQM